MVGMIISNRKDFKRKVSIYIEDTSRYKFNRLYARSQKNRKGRVSERKGDVRLFC